MAPLILWIKKNSIWQAYLLNSLNIEIKQYTCFNFQIDYIIIWDFMQYGIFLESLFYEKSDNIHLINTVKIINLNNLYLNLIK